MLEDDNRRARDREDWIQILLLSAVVSVGYGIGTLATWLVFVALGWFGPMICSGGGLVAGFILGSWWEHDKQSQWYRKRVG